MTQKIVFLIAISLTLLFADCNQADKTKTATKYDPCTNGHDTTFHLQFSRDTSTSEFYSLISFIESKGLFSGFDKKKCWYGDTILLQKLICEAKYYDSPKETWLLDNVFSVGYLLTSTKAIRQANENYFPKVYLTQYNFKTNAEKEKAYSKIKDIGWGDPLHKWNDYYVAHSKTKIYILETGAAIFSETKNKYGDIIQKEWIDKNSR
jgi:hypothetical protein